MKDFSKIYQLKGLKPKNKCRTNFYECCDLTKKVFLMHIFLCAATQCVGEYRNFLHLKNALVHLLGRVDLLHFLECKSCALNLFNAIMEKREHIRKSTILVCIFMGFSFAEGKNILIDSYFFTFFGHYLLHYTFCLF